MWVLRFRRHFDQTAADDSLAAHLTLSAHTPPAPDLTRGQTRLLDEVRRRRLALTNKGQARRTMPFTFGKKEFAVATAGVLALATVGVVGASGGVSDAAGDVGDVLAALHITDRAPDSADEHIDAIEQPADEGVGEPADEANDNASEGAENADDGINNSSASETGLDNAADNAFEGADNADGDHAPDALPEQADEHADDAGSAGPGVPDHAGVPDDVELPDQALPPAQD